MKLRSSIKAGSELEKLAGSGIFSSRSAAVAIGKLSGIRGSSASFSLLPSCVRKTFCTFLSDAVFFNRPAEAFENFFSRNLYLLFCCVFLIIFDSFDSEFLGNWNKKRELGTRQLIPSSFARFITVLPLWIIKNQTFVQFQNSLVIFVTW